MLRIFGDGSGPTTVLHVEGRLRGDGVGELRRACSEVEGSLVLDLSDLRYADEQGLRFLGALAKNGTELLKASPLILMLLEQIDDR